MVSMIFFNLQFHSAYLSHLEIQFPLVDSVEQHGPLQLSRPSYIHGWLRCGTMVVNTIRRSHHSGSRTWWTTFLWVRWLWHTSLLPNSLIRGRSPLLNVSSASLLYHACSTQWLSMIHSHLPTIYTQWSSLNFTYQTNSHPLDHKLRLGITFHILSSLIEVHRLVFWYPAPIRFPHILWLQRRLVIPTLDRKVSKWKCQMFSSAMLKWAMLKVVEDRRRMVLMCPISRQLDIYMQYTARSSRCRSWVRNIRQIWRFTCMIIAPSWLPASSNYSTTNMASTSGWPSMCDTPIQQRISSTLIRSCSTVERKS